jgi:hypothetical protein
MENKIMKCIGTVGYIAFDFLKFTGEILYDTFNHPCGSSQPQFGNGYKCNNENECEKYYDEATYEYMSRLTPDELNEYIATNEYLNRYNTESYIYSDNKQTAMRMAEIAYKENKSFTNKYNRY